MNFSWASWCGICVAGMDKVENLAEKYRNEVRFCGINVDKSGAIPKAKRIVAEKHLSYPQVMAGLGDRDPLWRQFGNVGSNNFNPPLYVVVNSTGTITYAGDGGTDLSDLERELIRDLRPSKSAGVAHETSE